MNQLLALEICSSKNNPVLQEWTELSAVRWQKKMERKLLRYKRTADAVKQAILEHDTIVGWVNFDTTEDKSDGSRLWKGYDKFFEKRILNDSHGSTAGNL